MSNIQREITDIISALDAWEEAGVQFRQVSLNIIADLRQNMNSICRKINAGHDMNGWPEMLVDRMSK